MDQLITMNDSVKLLLLLGSKQSDCTLSIIEDYKLVWTTIFGILDDWQVEAADKICKWWLKIYYDPEHRVCRERLLNAFASYSQVSG